MIPVVAANISKNKTIAISNKVNTAEILRRYSVCFFCCSAIIACCSAIALRCFPKLGLKYSVSLELSIVTSFLFYRLPPNDPGSAARWLRRRTCNGKPRRARFLSKTPAANRVRCNRCWAARRLFILLRAAVFK
jgi:hypothetical protein